MSVHHYDAITSHQTDLLAWLQVRSATSDVLYNFSPRKNYQIIQGNPESHKSTNFSGQSSGRCRGKYGSEKKPEQ